MTRIYLLIITIGLSLFSCTRDNSENGENVPEGKPVGMNLGLDQNMMTKSGLSNQQEQTINNIVVMVFDKTGTKVSQSYFDSNITASLQNIPTVSGSNMSVYVITNLTPQNTGLNTISNYFNAIHTVTELNQALMHD